MSEILYDVVFEFNTYNKDNKDMIYPNNGSRDTSDIYSVIQREQYKNKYFITGVHDYTCRETLTNSICEILSKLEKEKTIDYTFYINMPIYSEYLKELNEDQFNLLRRFIWYWFGKNTAFGYGEGAISRWEGWELTSECLSFGNKFMFDIPDISLILLFFRRMGYKLKKLFDINEYEHKSIPTVFKEIMLKFQDATTYRDYDNDDEEDKTWNTALYIEDKILEFRREKHYYQNAHDIFKCRGLIDGPETFANLYMGDAFISLLKVFKKYESDIIEAYRDDADFWDIQDDYCTSIKFTLRLLALLNKTDRDNLIGAAHS